MSLYTIFLKAVFKAAPSQMQPKENVSIYILIKDCFVLRPSS